MPIEQSEILGLECPFKVKWDGKRGKPIGKPIEVVGFSENDPLGVGGGLLPNFATVTFKGGGWILVADLMRLYSVDQIHT